MSEHSIPSHHIIFQEGDQSDAAFVIKSGAVEILKHAAHGEVLLAKLGPGDIFGEMGLLDPSMPRSATARTTADTIVDVLTGEEFNHMMNQCPARLIPIIQSVFERLRVTTQRVSSTEAGTVLLTSEFEKIVIQPVSPDLTKQFNSIDVPVARLPFRIGGKPTGQHETGKLGTLTHLTLFSEGPPLIISRQHCEISVENDGIYLVDMGSRFGTVVNGQRIGRGRGNYRVPLKKGNNQIYLGGPSSPYVIDVACV